MNRFTQLTPSTFKALDLNEIMAVPLTKRKQEDEAMLALDEFSKLQANALGPDKEYVSSQLAAFNKEADDIASEILEKGIDRNLVNKVRNLRSRKNKELSINGRTGQAAAAYNQYEANRKAIMARQDLTREQKEAGLAQALANYKGVVNNGIYEDYTGASYVDIMKRGREILKDLTPQERAEMLQMQFDPNKKVYTDGTYIHESLTPEHIAKVVSQALRGDRAAMDYMQEIESLGLGSVEDMIKQSATSAGNIGQVNKQKNVKFLPKNVLNNKKNIVDPSQPWSKRYMMSGIDSYNREFKIDEDYLKDVGFDEKTGMLPEFNKFEGDKYVASSFGYGANTQLSKRETSEYKDWKKNKAKGYEIQEDIKKIRLDNPAATEGKTDKEVFEIMKNMKTQAALAYSEVVKPYNVKNSFYHYGNLIKGDKDTDGDYTTRGMKEMGVTGPGQQVNYKTIAERLDMDEDEFNEAMKKGVLLGMVPSDPDFPMGNVIQIRDNDGNPRTLVLEQDANITESYPDAAIMMKNLTSGTRYSDGAVRYFKDDVTGQVKPFYTKYVTEINPATNKYEPRLIKSQSPISNEDASRIEVDRNGNVYLNGKLRNDIQISSYRDVINEMATGSTGLYDSVKTAN